MTELINHWIGGAPSQPESERTGPVYNPATGAHAADVAFATADEVDRAVDAAEEAFPEWRDTALARRQKILFAFRELVERQKLDIARLITAEHGKTLDDAVG
jgi:malonate-semialdehyde dehydrogenase (acetylating)/methylmalonate-semialdehyde dehydrogenase